MAGGIDGGRSAEDWSLRDSGLRQQAVQVKSNSFRLFPTNLINFPAIEQSPVWACEFGRRSKVEGVPISWPMVDFAHKSYAKVDRTYVRPWETQLQQKNASFSAGMKPQEQPKEAAISVGSNKEQKKGVSQLDKGTSSGFDEECKEFVRMFREKLQEFAMILSKKYHYNFLVEYFDDYHGSFNKEEFLGMEQQEEKLKERANKEARSIDHFMEEWEHESEVKERRNQKQNCYEDGLLVAEISSNVVKVEGLDNVEGFLSNDKKETVPAEERPADPKQCHHIAANFGVDIAETEVQIEGNCSQQKGKDVADWEEKNIESLAGKNKFHSIMFVVTTAGRLEFLSPLLKGGLKTGIDEAAQQVVSGAMQGINGIMFAYGATSSGKTHTMHGEQ